MTAQQLSARPAEWDQYEAYFTPLPVSLQGMWTLASVANPQTIVDVGAGSGSLGQAAAAAWPWAERVAIEARASEVPHLRRNYHKVVIGDALTAPLPSADLIIANPPFTSALALAERALAAVRPGGFVFFLVRQTWGDADDVEELLRLQPPVAELTISGRVSMAEAGQQTKDHFGYQWFAWGPRRPPGSPWIRCLLPRMDKTSLGWLARPGTGRLPYFDRELALDLRAIFAGCGVRHG